MTTAAAELELKDWLDAQFPAARLCTETPENLEEVLPCIRVDRFGGSREVIPVFDNPLVDVDCFAPNRDAARLLAHQVADAILFDLPGQLLGRAYVLRSLESSGPVRAPWGNPRIRRFTASYSIRFHTH